MDNNKLSFLYLTIFIFIVGILSNSKNNVFYLLVIFFAYYILNKNQNKNKDSNQDILNLEKKHKKIKITPESKNINKYQDIENFIFNIQEFVVYNYPAFQEMIESLDNFLDMYDTCIKVNDKAAIYYYNLEKEKHNTLNALHSIIFEIPSSPHIIEKLNISIKELDKILTNYLNKIEKIINDDILINGYNTHSIIINKGPKQYNFYDNKEFMYDFI